jgi:hypothetical protein
MNINDLEKNLDNLSIKEMEELLFSISGYEENPVDIEQFIEDARYLGNVFPDNDDNPGKGFYKYWMDELKKVYPSASFNPYWGVALRGSIGRGKSVTMTVMMAYELHKLLCMINPQKNLKVIPSTRIVFAIMNITLGLSNSVTWDQLNQYFATSPFFSERINLNKKLKGDTLFPKRIDMTVGSRVQHGLGQAVYSAVLDEAAFQTVENQVLKNFQSLISRMKSRFMKKGGGIPGKIIVASSEAEKASAINQIVDMYKHEDGFLVISGPIWEIRPWLYCGQTFKVFTGSDARQPEIINEDNKVLLELESPNIIDVPVEYRSEFEANIIDNIRDLAGVATSTNNKFIRLRDKVTSCLNQELIMPEIIKLDFDDEMDSIQNYLYRDKQNKTYFDNPIPTKSPRYIHLDIAKSQDRFGFACGAITGYRERKFKNAVTLEERYEVVPELTIEFAFAIEAYPGKQIPIYKAREFIFWMSKKGYRIAKITADTYGSVEFLQALKLKNYIAEELSVDRSSQPYFSFRDTMYQLRVNLPKSELLKQEVFELEYDSKTDKVDHPAVFSENNSRGSKKGSKDISDASVGVVYNLNQDAQMYRVLSDTVSQKTQTNELKRLKDQFWGMRR